jgi:hypothetical protein
MGGCVCFPCKLSQAYDLTGLGWSDPSPRCTERRLHSEPKSRHPRRRDRMVCFSVGRPSKTPIVNIEPKRGEYLR